MVGLIKVSGDSMSPTLLDGDIVITLKPRTIRAGLIYVINHSDLGQIIKRVEAQDVRGRLILKGDNPQSTPSAIMGSVEPSRVKARARLRLSQRGVKWL